MADLEGLTNETWLILFTDGDKRVGLKTRTNGVAHPPRWESSPPMFDTEMMRFMAEAAAVEAES